MRLAELVATPSLATDLGHGQPLQHTVRQTRLAMRIADAVGLDEDERIATYYTSLLDSAYCHADAHEQAQWFGDDIGLKADSYEADTESFGALLLALRRLGAGDAGLARARRIASFPFGGWKELNGFLVTHSNLQSPLFHRHRSTRGGVHLAVPVLRTVGRQGPTEPVGG